MVRRGLVVQATLRAVRWPLLTRGDFLGSSSYPSFKEGHNEYAKKGSGHERCHLSNGPEEGPTRIPHARRGRKVESFNTLFPVGMLSRQRPRSGQSAQALFARWPGARGRWPAGEQPPPPPFVGSGGTGSCRPGSGPAGTGAASAPAARRAQPEHAAPPDCRGD